MTAIHIPCPQCQASLRLPGPELLGKKGKCPKCGLRFVLNQPEEEVPLEIVSSAPPVAAPLPGVAARWVPDAHPEHAAANNAPLSQSSAGTQSDSADARSPFDFTGQAATPAAGPATPVVAPAAEESGVPVTQRVRRRKKKSSLTMILVGGGVAIVLGVVIGVVVVNQQNRETAANARPQPPERNAAWDEEQEQLASSNEQAEALSPTAGEEIPLSYLPFTPHVVCHLRPAELWQRGRTFQEFDATLGQLGIWLKEQIPTLTHFQPEEIEELTFAINFGARMSEPEVAAVVRLREAHTQSDLFKRFDARMRPEYPGVNLYECEKDGLNFLKIDAQTFCVSSAQTADSLVDAVKFPPVASPDMAPLLKASDRKRHFTLIFDVPTLDVHREFVFIEQLQQLIDEFVIWIGDEVETVAWSMHLEPNLYMETLLRQATDSSPMKVERSIKLQLQRLPERLAEVVPLMRPETTGRYQLISRFPAMMKAVSAGTSYHIGPGYVRLVTILPMHAAPGLAAASIYTWDQSVVTDFATAKPVGPTATEIPELIVDRLKLKVLIDFRGTPLNETFEYIGDAIKTEFVLDGDGFKQAGFTQVMRQTYNLGDVPAVEGIHAMLQKYAPERDPMVIVIDQDANQVIVTVKSVADAKGMQIYDTSAR